MYVRDEKQILIENRWNLPLSWMPDYGRNVGAWLCDFPFPRKPIRNLEPNLTITEWTSLVYRT